MAKTKSAQQILDQQLKKYQDNAGLNTGRLNFGLWYLNHRKHFFLGLVGLLSLVVLALWSYSLYYFGDYLLRGMTAQQQTLAILSQNTLQSPRIDYSSNLKYEMVKVLPLSNNRYDLVGSVTNGNDRFVIRFNYYFLINDEPVGLRQGLVWPMEKKYVLALNQVLGEQSGQVNLVLDNINLQRLDSHAIPDWPSYRQDYLNFVVQDKKFLSSDQSGLSDQLRFSQLNFQITNQTAFSYYEAPLDIILFNRQEVVGATRYVLSDFLSRGQRLVNLNLLGNIPQVSEIIIQPDIDILDQSVFKLIQ